MSRDGKKPCERRALPALRGVLPTGLTLANLLCGVGVVLLCLGDSRLDRAALLIFLGFALDLADGRVARWLDATSDFGKELDSLVDIVSFGVAPAVLFYAWAELDALGLGGALIAAGFVVAAALRLARFNLPGRSPGSAFQGLPTPVAAACIAALVLFERHQALGLDDADLLRVALLPGLSILMLSRLRYPSFKRVASTGTGSLFFLLAIAGLILSSLVLPWLGPLVLAAYLASGPLDEIFGRLARPRPEGAER